MAFQLVLLERSVLLTQTGDLLIICSGSGETGSLKSLAEKAKQSGIDLALVTMKKESTIGQLADVVLVLPVLRKKMIEKQPLLLNQWGLRLNNWLFDL